MDPIKHPPELAASMVAANARLRAFRALPPITHTGDVDAFEAAQTVCLAEECLIMSESLEIEQKLSAFLAQRHAGQGNRLVETPVDRALVVGDYTRRGDEFTFVSLPDGLGYYAEPWGDECFQGRADGQPPPVELGDREVEMACLDWAMGTGHAGAVVDIVKQAPPGWTKVADFFEGDVDDPFGVSFVVFTHP